MSVSLVVIAAAFALALSIVGALIVSGLMRRWAGDHAECRRCGYNTDSAASAACSECGTDLQSFQPIRAGRTFRRQTAFLLSCWTFAFLSIVVGFWPKLIEILPWTIDRAQLMGFYNPRPNGSYDDILLSCQARATKGWLDGEEALTEFRWTATYRVDDVAVATIVVDELNDISVFTAGEQSTRRDEELNAQVIEEWLNKLFPRANIHLMRSDIDTIFMWVDRWMSWPDSMDAGGKSEWANLGEFAPGEPAFPGVKGRVGRVGLRPDTFPLLLVLIGLVCIWIGGAGGILLWGRHRLERHLALSTSAGIYRDASVEPGDSRS